MKPALFGGVGAAGVAALFVFAERVTGLAFTSISVAFIVPVGAIAFGAAASWALYTTLLRGVHVPDRRSRVVGAALAVASLVVVHLAMAGGSSGLVERIVGRADAMWVATGRPPRARSVDLASNDGASGRPTWRAIASGAMFGLELLGAGVGAWVLGHWLARGRDACPGCRRAWLRRRVLFFGTAASLGDAIARSGAIRSVDDLRRWLEEARRTVPPDGTLPLDLVMCTNTSCPLARWSSPLGTTALPASLTKVFRDDAAS